MFKGLQNVHQCFSFSSLYSPLYSTLFFFFKEAKTCPHTIKQKTAEPNSDNLHSAEYNTKPKKKKLYLKDLPEKAGISNQSTAVPKTCSTYPRVWIFSVWLRTAGEQDGETRFSPQQELLRLSPSALLFSGTAALLPASCQSRTGLRPGLVWVWWAWAQQACFGFPGDDGTAPWPPHWRVGILMPLAQTACPHVATRSWPCCPVEWARDTQGDAWPRRWATR